VICVPVDTPSICVCTAPATPKVHKSLLLVLIVGLIADAGGDFKSVSCFVVTVLSVIIGSGASDSCANAAQDNNDPNNIG
jgi:hypothetical protein